MCTSQYEISFDSDYKHLAHLDLVGGELVYHSECSKWSSVALSGIPLHYVVSKEAVPFTAHATARVYERKSKCKSKRWKCDCGCSESDHDVGICRCGCDDHKMREMVEAWWDHCTLGIWTVKNSGVVETDGFFTVGRRRVTYISICLDCDNTGIMRCDCISCTYPCSGYMSCPHYSEPVIKSVHLLV